MSQLAETMINGPSSLLAKMLNHILKTITQILLAPDFCLLTMKNRMLKSKFYHHFLQDSVEELVKNMEEIIENAFGLNFLPSTCMFLNFSHS